MAPDKFGTVLFLSVIIQFTSLTHSYNVDENFMKQLEEYKQRYHEIKNAEQKYTGAKEIPYGELKPYFDITIPEIREMYDDSVKSYVYKYYVDKNVQVYKKYLFQQVIDEWFLHVPCYTMKDIGEGAALKCPPDNPDLGKGQFGIPFKGSACVTDQFGCSLQYLPSYEMYVISIDDLRRCGPGMIHSFVAKTLGVRSPIQEPDRNEHVTVNFENVDIGLLPSSFDDHSWRELVAPQLEDLDSCRKTTEEIYQMKTATFPKGIFDYGSVLVPGTFQYSDPLDPRAVTVTKEIYEQVRLDRSKYGHDFRLALTGNDLFRMRLFFTCGVNGKCFHKNGVCKNMGFVGASPLLDIGFKHDQGVSCECFCPYSDLKGQFCEVNAFMKYKFLDTKAMCFKFITKNGKFDVEEERGELETERGRNVLAPGAKSSFVYAKKDIFSDAEAGQLTQDQDKLVAMFHPPAEMKKMGGLAVAPDVWVSKQWCTFIWAPPATKRAVVTVDPSRLWESKMLKGTTEAWMNPAYPMQDWFATVKADNSKKIALFVVGLLLTLAMLGGGGYLLYYFVVIKPTLDDDTGYEKVETAYNTPGEATTPAGGSSEGLKLD
ncbi:hypothetical protein FJT64_012658 [Amphibalanus amphitrite]|uniref:Uncharacterized protein n=1 Tax=Amphibalanus amphitrite TaxID=1232801 RepID=A0A6A4VCK5_AMPAM|nr:hypothetical protein FJT64_012658 [Amphibalanus amphitrite]